MKNLFVHTSISAVMALALIFVWTQPVRAAQASETQQYILTLINQMRMDPVAYAQNLGFDAETLLEERPWLSDILQMGLPLLISTDYLSMKAAALNDPSGNSVVPVPSFSQNSAVSGTITGVVSFFNFVAPEIAVQTVLEHQFKQELDSEFQGQRSILNRDLDLAGASFFADTDLVDASRRLAYYVTVSLGSSLSKSSRQLLNLVNQVRADPIKAGTWLSMPLGRFVSNDYQPLFFHEVLQDFAATDYVHEEAYALLARDYGYMGSEIHRVSTIRLFPKINENTMVFWSFFSLILNEIRGFPDGNVIFGTRNKDAGLRFEYASGLAYDQIRLTMITGKSENQQPDMFRIYGLVYEDTKENNAYNPGEGRPGFLVAVYDQETFLRLATAVTDETGHFSVLLPGNKSYSYTIQAESDEPVTGEEFFLDRDRFIAIKLTNSNEITP
jgi:hypothetical protein